MPRKTTAEKVGDLEAEVINLKETITELAKMVAAIGSLLDEKGILTLKEFDEQMEEMDDAASELFPKD